MLLGLYDRAIRKRGLENLSRPLRHHAGGNHPYRDRPQENRNREIPRFRPESQPTPKSNDAMGKSMTNGNSQCLMRNLLATTAILLAVHSAFCHSVFYYSVFDYCGFNHSAFWHSVFQHPYFHSHNFFFCHNTSPFPFLTRTGLTRQTGRCRLPAFSLPHPDKLERTEILPECAGPRPKVPEDSFPGSWP